MTALDASFGVLVPGIPKPKGSMTCRAPHLPGRHAQMVEAVDNDEWRAQVERAADEIPVRGITGPVALTATFTLPRPGSHYRHGTPTGDLSNTAPAWPSRRGTGDLEKLVRIIGDAWQAKGGAGVIVDDSQIVNATIWKCYPDSPACPDQLDRPGAIIRIHPL